MALVREPNEIQDSEILKHTVQETGGKDSMRLIFKEGASDEPLVTSDWFPAAKRREAVIAWMGAVRAALVERWTQREKERRQRAKDAPRAPTLALPAGIARNPVTDAAGLTPQQYVSTQLKNANSALKYWNAAKDEADYMVEQSRASVVQWEQILESLGGIVEEHDEAPVADANGVADSATGSGSVGYGPRESAAAETVRDSDTAVLQRKSSKRRRRGDNKQSESLPAGAESTSEESLLEPADASERGSGSDLSTDSD